MRAERFGVLQRVVVVAVVGLSVGACTGDDASPPTDADTPVSSVDAEVVDGASESEPASPGTLTVTGTDDTGSTTPDAAVPDQSTVPPADGGGGGGDGADGAADPPDVSTQPSG